MKRARLRPSLKRTAGEQILAGGSAHDIAVKVNAADLEARAYDQAAHQALQKMSSAARNLLDIHAEDYSRQHDKAGKDLKAHMEKVNTLLGQLQDLEGCDFEQAYEDATDYAARNNGPNGFIQVPASNALQERSTQCRNKNSFHNAVSRRWQISTQASCRSRRWRSARRSHRVRSRL